MVSMLKLDAELNRKILKLAPKFEAKDMAPHSYETLKLASVSGLVVWAGASEGTIYGCPTVNHAFRAWHDSLHLKLNAPFTLEGEARVAREQARILGGDVHGAVILGEIVGQAEHFAKFGEFPTDQMAFMLQYLKRKGVL